MIWEMQTELRHYARERYAAQLCQFCQGGEAISLEYFGGASPASHLGALPSLVLRGVFSTNTRRAAPAAALPRKRVSHACPH